MSTMDIALLERAAGPASALNTTSHAAHTGTTGFAPSSSALPQPSNGSTTPQQPTNDLDSRLRSFLQDVSEDAQTTLYALLNDEAAVTDDNVCDARELLVLLEKAHPLILSLRLTPPEPIEPDEAPIYGVRCGKSGRNWL